MPIIFVCSSPFGGGEKLARSLAGKLGYAFLSRDDVVARAHECGIPVGKIELAMVKKPSVQERLARLKERYLAVATATICEKAAAEKNLIYYGRAGHHLLPGVSHVLRLRVIPEPGQRLERAMEQTKLPREKAETFLRDIDADIRDWVRFVHGVEMEDPSKYDFVVNLEHMSLENAATSLCGIAELPDFRPTPASLQAMEESLLQSRARIKLAMDEETAEETLTVRASGGVITVTYPPRQARLSSRILALLGDLPNCRQVRCTMAETNILWIQEAYQPDSAVFQHLTELTRRWGAAVELLRYLPEDADEGAADPEMPALQTSSSSNGGIEEDTLPEPLSPEERLFQDTVDALVHAGRSGGGSTVAGNREKLVAAINPDINYSLVAVGDLFLQKPPAARVRMTRELSSFLSQFVRAPVVATQDLGSTLRFGPRQALKLAVALAITALIYAVVFLNQEPVMELMGGSFQSTHTWLTLLVVATVVPLVACCYGIVAGSLVKLLKLE